jgi:hypothetical protein
MQRVIHTDSGPEIHPGSKSPEKSDCSALLQRIAASKTFHRSPRLRDLLLDIGQHTLASGNDELSEHAIGVRVFEREPSYNPGDDNIVRASVRQLRLKIKEYFESEGSDESLFLEVPKGSYVAVFTPRPTPAPIELPQRPALFRDPRFSWAAGSAAMVALLAGATWLLSGRSLDRPGPEPATIFTTLLAQNSNPVNFILTDSAVVILNRLTGAKPSIEEYSSGKFLQQGANGLDPQMRELWPFIATRQITSLADVLILTRLYQENPSAAKRIQVRYARHMQTRDFKSGNFIVTGSSRANPWTDLFESSLNFQLDFTNLRVTNASPLKTEPRLFEARQDGPDFARVALLRNLAGDGFVLLIAGLQAEGTEGAGEFLLRSDSLQQIQRVLGLGSHDPLPLCEFVVEIKTIQGTARSASIVAWRRH